MVGSCATSRFPVPAPFRTAALLFGLVLSPWPCLLQWATAGIPEGRPNVLLIVTDDQRPDTIGALGNANIQTPHLDQLARSGSVMTRAVSPNPICTPSRAELISGCTGFRNGVLDFGKRIDPQLVLWPEAMRRAGYDTWYVGKWHTDGVPVERGYDESNGLFMGGGRKFWKEQVDYRGHPVTGYVGWVFRTDDGKLLPQWGVGLTPDISRRFADSAIQLIRRKHARPFFLHVNFTAPHDPLLIPPGYEGRYRAEEIPLPPNFRKQHPFDHGNLRGRDERLLPFPRTASVVKADLAAYYAVISYLDQQVGRILAALEQSALRENTIVVFTSDHGLAMGSHGLRGKQNMYEHTVGVPLILSGPTLAKGKRFSAQVYLRDLYPTICQLCRVPVPLTMDGKSFVDVLRGTKTEIHPFVVGYFRQCQRMIRTNRWKLIEYPQVGRRQLFDLETDRFELRDLSEDASQAERIGRLSKRLSRWLAVAGDSLARRPQPGQRSK